MSSRKLRMAALVLAMGLSGFAQAALHDRGGGLIYDDVFDVTWLANANYAQTSGYDVDGLMTIGEASGWASSLIYHDVIRNVDYTDWRLPETAGLPWEPDPACNGLYSDYNCTGSEMGQLFYVDLGGVAGTSIAITHNAAYSLFSNIQPGTYWSGTSVPNTSLMWSFDMDTGRQHTTDAVGDYITYPTHYAWAVRNGDVVAVPEPETYAMLLAGLGLVSFAVRCHASVKYIKRSDDFFMREKLRARHIE